MRLLAGIAYDPAAAVTKATSALLAMTAIDTTNLRAAITAPVSGTVRWRLVCTVHGATTLPSLLLGVMDGNTVRARLAPMVGGGNLIATGRYQLEATGLITGLTPGGNYNLDAAYGVEVVVASTGIKYGGPNNTTTNDAFGAITFEVWDVTTQSSGSGATAAEVWAHGTRTLTANPGLTAAQVNAEVDTALADVGLTSTITGRIDVALSTRLATASYTVPPTVGAIRAEMDANSTKLANLDAAVTTRLAASSYVAPDNAAINAVGGAVTDLVADVADVQAAVDTRMAAADYVAPVDVSADVAAVKTKVDGITIDAMGCVQANTYCINGTRVQGAGTAGNPWRPV